MSSNQQHPAPILGYKIVEQVGQGGYGQVWKVEAPGGLMKAMKIVPNYHQEDHRQADESKALHRVREVRHPFLLSLERIEVVDGQLITVTELADQSMRDRFNDCCQSGISGIPLDELLQYIREAADALDYMSDNYSLQHMDIKPENLLLLAGHVKVADFGLVKNIRSMTATLIGGLSPRYAAPEVFSGAPTRFSDQYSLAILFQEMLTGFLPFDAKSPAELTMQHLNAAPDLSALPEAFRPVIARGLAKKPLNRFESCGELSDAILEAAGKKAPGSAATGEIQIEPQGAPESRRSVTYQITRTLVRAGSPELGSLPPQVRLELPRLTEPVIRDLGQLTLDQKQPKRVPTLVLAIGGTAAEALLQFNRKVRDQLGTAASQLPLSMLLLDTDTKSLFDATRGDKSSVLARNQIVPLPLKRPQEYRADSKRLLKWLNRRWLYNIPKSLQTEGLRPLGRLAFADHASEIIDRLDKQIRRLLDPEDPEKTDDTDLTEKNALKVYIVSSISGGSGSGMVIDIAYSLHMVLEQLGVEEPEVVGLLLHSTGTSPRHRDVAKVNAFSWLTEFNHYNLPGGEGYPGDESLGITAFPPQRPTFDQTYLVHLGDDLTERQLSAAVEQVADYMFLDTFTAASSFFQGCRNDHSNPPEIVSNQASVRTLGVFKKTCFQDQIIAEATAQFCTEVVNGWCEDAPDAVKSKGFAADQSESTDEVTVDFLDTQKLLEHSAELVRQRCGVQSVSELEELVSNSLQNGVVEDDSFFQIKEDGRLAFGLSDPNLTRLLTEKSEELSAQASEALSARLRHPGFSLIDYNNGAQWVAMRCEQIRSQLDGLQSPARFDPKAASGKSADSSGRANKDKAAVEIARARHHARQQLNRCYARLAKRILSTLESDVRNHNTKVFELRRELRSVSREFQASLGTAVQQLETPLQTSVRQVLAGKKDKVVSSIRETVFNDFLEPNGGLVEIYKTAPELWQGLAQQLRSFSSAATRETISEMDPAHTVLKPADEDNPHSLSDEVFERVVPRLLQYGGATRVLAMLPSYENGVEDYEHIGKLVSEDASWMEGRPAELIVCCEVAQMSLAHIAVGLIGGRSDYAEFSARVHTRQDVEWSSVADAAAQPVNESESELTAP